MAVSNLAAPAATIGGRGAASRRKMRPRGDETGEHQESGPWVHVSRLGNPLFNELLIPMVKKDGWNGSQPSGDSEYLDRVEHPELQRALPDASRAPRKDMTAILLTGLKAGMAKGLQT